jgi:osmotically-inducible protein OsmY
MLRFELEGEVVRVPSRGAIAALAAYSVVACSTSPPRSPAERAADAAAAARVEAALDEDPRIYARHVDVRVDRGVVHLGGFVWSDNELFFAKNDAASVPGIRTVVDEMELMRGGMTGGSSR